MTGVDPLLDHARDHHATARAAEQLRSNTLLEYSGEAIETCVVEVD